MRDKVQDATLLLPLEPIEFSPRRKSHIGKSTVLAIAPAKWEWFEGLEGDHMEEHLLKIKRAFARNFLEKILQIYPNIIEHIDHIEVLPPFWHRDTLGKYKAGVYGLHHNDARYDDAKLIAR